MSKFESFHQGLRSLAAVVVSYALSAGAAEIGGYVSGAVTWHDGDIVTSAVTIAADATITIEGTVIEKADITVSGGSVTFTSAGDGVLVRDASLAGNMLNVTGGAVTLSWMTLDGADIACAYKGVSITGGTLAINDGANLCRHSTTVSKGSALSVTGTGTEVTMNGGFVQGCTNTKGYGTIYLGTGTVFVLNSGSVQNNAIPYTTVAYGGGGFYIDKATLTMNGGVIQNNSTLVGGNIATGAGGGAICVASSTSTATSKIYLNGGLITGNMAKRASAVGYGDGIYWTMKSYDAASFIMNGAAVVMDECAIGVTTSTKSPFLSGALKYPLSIYLNNSYGTTTTILEGSGYTPTESDASKVSLSKAASSVLTQYDAVLSGTLMREAADGAAVAYEQKFYVNYLANGGTGVTSDDAAYDAGATPTVAANTFAREDFSFAGWNTAADGSGTAYAAGATLPALSADMVLYAQWTHTTHHLVYAVDSASGKIVQSCTRCAHTASVAIDLPSETREYRASAWTPATTSKDAAWSGTEPTLAYENNVNAGTAKAILAVGADCAVTNEFAISKKPMTVTFTVAGKTYDGTTAATLASFSYSGRLSADAAKVSCSGEGMTYAFAAKDVGTWDVTATGYADTLMTGDAAGNYAYTFNATATAKAAIAAAALSVSGLAAANKAYDGTTAATLDYAAATYTGLVAGDSVSVTAVGTFADAAVGTDKTVYLTSYALTGDDAANYVLASGLPTTTTASITAAALAVSGITANDKAYDGTTAATVNMGSATLTGKVSEYDDVRVTATGATFDTAAVGSGKTVTVTGLALDGSAAANYTLASATATATAAITPRPVTVTGLKANDKNYDGTTDATVDCSAAAFTGLLDGDVLTASVTGAKFADANAGNKITVTLGTITLAGSAAGNYTVADGSQTTSKANINKLVVAVTAGITASDTVYNGSANGLRANVNTMSGTEVTFVPAIPDEVRAQVTVTATGAYATKDVETDKEVTLSGWTLGGTAAANYTLAAEGNQTTTTASVTPCPLVVSGIKLKGYGSRMYDGTDEAASVLTTEEMRAYREGTSSPWYSSDTITVSVPNAVFTGRESNKAVGENLTIALGEIVLGGASAANYSVSASSQTEVTGGAITKKDVTVTDVVPEDKEYDGTVLATKFTAGGIDGVVAGDDVTVKYTGAFADAAVGADKAVTLSGATLSGADAGNYNLKAYTLVADAKAAITRRAVTVTEITANDKEYDGTTTATVDCSAAVFANILAADEGLLTVSAPDAAFTSADASDEATVTLGTLVLGGDMAANYVVSADSQSEVTPVVITKKDATVTFTVEDKAYDGTTAATCKATTIDGLADADKDDADKVACDTSSVIFAFTEKKVGKHDVTASGFEDACMTGTAAANYNWTFASTASAQATISKKDATVSFTAKDKAYDGTAAAELLEFTYEGVADGDDVSCSGAGMTYTFASAALGEQAVTATGWKAGLMTGADAGNYNWTFAGLVSATISARPATVTFTAKDKAEYDGTDAAELNAFTYTGVLDGELKDVSCTGAGMTYAFASADAGTWSVTATGWDASLMSGSKAGNYAWTFTSTATAPATIGKKALTVTASTVTKEYGETLGATAGTEVTATGLVGTDALTVNLKYDDSKIALATPGSGLAKAGTHAGAIVENDHAFTSGSAGNYDYSFTAGDLEVTAKPLTVTANAQTMDYGSIVVPDLDGQYVTTGLVAGDALDVTLAYDLEKDPSGNYEIGEHAGVIVTNAVELQNADCYALTFNAGTLTVNAALAGVSIDNGITWNYYGDWDTATNKIVEGCIFRLTPLVNAKPQLVFLEPSFTLDLGGSEFTNQVVFVAPETPMEYYLTNGVFSGDVTSVAVAPASALPALKLAGLRGTPASTDVTLHVTDVTFKGAAAVTGVAGTKAVFGEGVKIPETATKFMPEDSELALTVVAGSYVNGAVASGYCAEGLIDAVTRTSDNLYAPVASNDVECVLNGRLHLALEDADFYAAEGETVYLYKDLVRTNAAAIGKAGVTYTLATTNGYTLAADGVVLASAPLVITNGTVAITNLTVAGAPGVAVAPEGVLAVAGEPDLAVAVSTTNSIKLVGALTKAVTVYAADGCKLAGEAFGTIGDEVAYEDNQGFFVNADDATLLSGRSLPLADVDGHRVRVGTSLIWLTPADAPSETPVVGGRTAHMLTVVNAQEAYEFAAVTNGIAETNWFTAVADGACTITNLVKDTEYTVLMRHGQTAKSTWSPLGPSATARTLRFSAVDIANAFDDAVASETADDTASNDFVTVRPTSDGSGYTVTLDKKRDTDRGAVLWDDIGNLTIELNGQWIRNLATGSVQAGLYFKHSADYQSESAAVVTLVGPGRIVGAAGTNGCDAVASGDATSGANGGAGIAAASDCEPMTLNIGSDVAVYGGAGGSGGSAVNGNAGNGANGGDALAGNFTVTANGATLTAGAGGNGGTATNGAGGNGGNGGNAVKLADRASSTFDATPCTAGTAGKGGVGDAATGADGTVGISGQRAAPAPAEILAVTGSSIQFSGDADKEYALYLNDVELIGWTASDPSGTNVFVNLEKDTDYRVLSRYAEVSVDEPASYAAEQIVRTAKYDEADVAGFFAGVADVTLADGRYVATLTDDITGGVTLPGDLGELTLDLAGYAIMGSDGIASSADADGLAALTIEVAADPATVLTVIGSGRLAGGNGAMTDESVVGFVGNGGNGGAGIALANGVSIVFAATGADRIEVVGGAAADGADANHGTSGNGGQGGDALALPEVGTATYVINDSVTLVGGRGGNGANGSDAGAAAGGNGGNGGDAVTGTDEYGVGGNGGNAGLGVNGAAAGVPGAAGLGKDEAWDGAVGGDPVVALHDANGVTYFASLTNAVKALADDATLVLLADVAVTAPVDLGNHNVEIDGEGFTITLADDQAQFLALGEEGVLAVTNLTVAGGTADVCDIETKGNLTISAGTTLRGVTVTSGSFELEAGSLAALTVTGGQVLISGGMVTDLAATAGTVEITAGKFTTVALADECEVTVSGGTFAVEPTATWLATGYRAEAEGSDWNVMWNDEYQAVAVVGTDVTAIPDVGAFLRSFNEGGENEGVTGLVTVSLGADVTLTAADLSLIDQAAASVAINGSGHTIKVGVPGNDGAVLFAPANSLVLTDVTIDGNGTSNAFLVVYESVNVVLNRVKVTGFAGNDYAVISASSAGVDANVTLRDTVITGNTAPVAVDTDCGVNAPINLYLCGATEVHDNGAANIRITDFEQLILADALTAGAGKIGITYADQARYDGRFAIVSAAANLEELGMETFFNDAGAGTEEEPYQIGVPVAATDRDGNVAVCFKLDPTKYDVCVVNAAGEANYEVSLARALEDADDTAMLYLQRDVSTAAAYTAANGFTLDGNGFVWNLKGASLALAGGTATFTNCTVTLSAPIAVKDAAQVKVCKGAAFAGATAGAFAIEGGTATVALEGGVYDVCPAAAQIASGFAAYPYADTDPYQFEVRAAPVYTNVLGGVTVVTALAVDPLTGKVALNLADQAGKLTQVSSVTVPGVTADAVDVTVPKGWLVTKTANDDGSVTVAFALDEATLAPVFENADPGQRAISFVTEGGVLKVSVSVANAVPGFWYTLEGTEDLANPFAAAADAVQATADGNLVLTAPDDTTMKFFKVVVKDEE